jgi:chromosome segregation ATPase
VSAYVRGAATTAKAARQAVERERAEVEQLYAEGRKLAQTAKQLRQRNANLEARIAEERERLEDKRATLNTTLLDLQAAQQEADNAIREAEANATTIRELAYDQARAITERAYRHGYDKGQDRARAQHAVLRKYTPKPDGRRPGVTNRRTPVAEAAQHDRQKRKAA